MTQTDTAGNGVDGRAVARLRRAVPLTQEQLAARAGISQSYLSQIESGARTVVSAARRRAIAAALGCAVTDISGVQQVAVLTIEQAAARLAIHPETVRVQCRAGKIPAVQVGRQWRIPVHVVDAMLTPPPAERAS